MGHINKIGEDLEKRGVNTLAVELEGLGLRALAKNGQNPEKAKSTLYKLMLDTPRVFVELFGGKDVVLEKGHRYLCELKRRHDEAKAAAERDETRAGHGTRAEKAIAAVPAAPRLPNGESGQRSAASDGRTVRAASPPPQNRDGGQAPLAREGHGFSAAPRSTFGKEEGHSAPADKANADVPSPLPSKRSGAGPPSRADQGHTVSARPAAIPVKTERIDTSRDLKSDASVVRALSKEVLKTFEVYDGSRYRDMAEVPPAQWDKVRAYHSQALEKGAERLWAEGEKYAKHWVIVETIEEMTKRRDAGKTISPAEMRVIQRRHESRAVATVKGGIKGAHEALAIEDGGRSAPITSGLVLKDIVAEVMMR